MSLQHAAFEYPFEVTVAREETELCTSSETHFERCGSFVLVQPVVVDGSTATFLHILVMKWSW